MSTYQYDLFVIGAGSGGVRAARMAAQYGGRVAIAEDLYLGGTCVNVGCVPKKLLVQASSFDNLLRDAAGFGWDIGAPVFDWPVLIRNKDAEIQRLNDVYQRLLEQAGVQIYQGHASLSDAHTISINGTSISARNILIATGGWPWVPSFPGAEFAITSNEIFHLPELPQRVAIVGGGYIAVEFACILNGMGVETHLIYRDALFLRGFDRELREHLAQQMAEKGVVLHFQCSVERIDKNENGLRLALNSGAVLETDSAFYATGRRPRTDGLGLDVAGVALDANGYVEVNDYFQTNVPNIYAVGDVIGGAELTPVALAQGMAVAKTLFQGRPTALQEQLIPTAVFSQPNFASVGLGEEDARDCYGDIAVFTTKFTQLRHTLAGNQEKTFMKLVVDRATDRVVGAHMVGPEAGEIIQGLAVAMQAGATKAHFDATLGIHPTAAEEFVTMRMPAR